MSMPASRSGMRLLYALVGLTVATSFIVLVEPAPTDALFTLSAVLAAGISLRLLLPRAGIGIYAPLYVFLLANLISLVFVESIGASVRFLLITGYMVASFLFFTGLVAADGPRASSFLLRALCVAAALAAAVGILARFHLLPDSELFFRDETGMRIRSTFKDPNVFSPFLVAAFVATLSRITSARRISPGAGGLLILYATAIILAFSRGAYFHLGVSLFVFAILHVLVLQRPTALRRLGTIAVLLGTVGIPVLAITLSATGLDEFFAQRLGLQRYDENRFANQELALTVALDNPLGIGPGMFSEDRGYMAVHNLYIRVLVENGILGLIALLAFFLVWFLRSLSGVLARGEHADTYVCCTAIMAGALAESWIIDTLHWRHLFLILAIPVGLGVYERYRAPETSRVGEVERRPVRSKPEELTVVTGL